MKAGVTPWSTMTADQLLDRAQESMVEAFETGQESIMQTTALTCLVTLAAAQVQATQALQAATIIAAGGRV